MNWWITYSILLNDHGNIEEKKNKKTILLRAYYGCFMHGIVTHVKLPFFKVFSNFVHFCPYFQIFCPFLPFFWKIVLMPLLSRISLAIIDYTMWLSERRVFFPFITKVWELVPKSGQRNLVHVRKRARNVHLKIHT